MVGWKEDRRLGSVSLLFRLRLNELSSKRDGGKC